MTPKERQLATIRHEPTGRISLDAICVENVPDIAAYLGIAAEQVYDRLGIDGRVVAAGYTGPAPTGPSGEATSEWRTLTTCDYGTGHWYPLQDVSSIAEVERFDWPDPALYDYSTPARAAEAMGNHYAIRGPYWYPVFCRVCEMFGMEEAMVRMEIDRAIFEAALEQVFSRVYQYCERMLDACGDNLHIFCLGDDFATQRGLMISPERWREFLKPRYAKLFDMARRRGKFVWFHSCGDITSVLPDLIDIGLDIWETVQLHALPMSPEQLKSEFGKHITFFGAINTQNLPFARPDEVRDEVERVIRVLGADGGYICGPDHHVKPDVSVANTLALFDAAQGFDTKQLFTN